MSVKKENAVTDREILECFARDKEAGLRLFLDRYERALYAHLRTILREDGDTDDAYQNSCLKIYSNLSRFEGRSGLFTWAYRIATNEALSILRQRKRRRSYAINEELNTATDVNVNYDALLEVFHRAIDRLPPQQQLVFQLRYFGDQSYEEIAEGTGTSVGGLKANYHHARKKIETYIIEQNIL
jgi:RNA polymerase sigma-70 factor (ECF subfamily)